MEKKHRENVTGCILLSSSLCIFCFNKKNLNICLTMSTFEHQFLGLFGFFYLNMHLNFMPLF